MGRSDASLFWRRWKLVALAAAGMVLLVGIYLAAQTYWTSSQSVVGMIPGETKPWKMEVVNTTSEAGLALRIADHLRRLGYDVVDVRTSRMPGPVRTSFIDRSGRPEALSDLQAVLELTPDRFRSELDRTLLLDVTMLVGNDIRTIPAFAADVQP
ncbi:MAG: LytR C-terminal domain-containing protein [Bacteroidetes bacterium]|jgi:hypothetical protein|nr:LytR C-terminal domain-containing protein [Bacteroidota bacterium]